MTTLKYVIVICVNDEGENLKDSIGNTCSVGFKICKETLNLIDDNQADIIKNWLQNNDKFVTFDKYVITAVVL